MAEKTSKRESLDTYKVLFDKVGIGGMSSSEYNKWRQEQLAAGKIYSNSPKDDQNIVYLNQQFAKRYGVDTFRSLPRERRNRILLDDYMNEQLKPMVNPFQTNPSQANSKEGVGSASLYEDVMNMTPEGKLELWNSDWVPNEAVENKWTKPLEKVHEFNKKVRKYTNPFSIFPNPFNAIYYRLISGVVDDLEEGMREAVSNNRQSANKAILEKILKEDTDRLKDSEEYKSIRKEYADRLFYDTKEEDINKQFTEVTMQYDPQLGVLFNDKGEAIDDKVEDFNIDKKREYLADFYALTSIKGGVTGADAMSLNTRQYLSDRTPFVERVTKFRNDFKIAALSYAFAKVNGVRALWNTIERETAPYIVRKEKGPNGEIIENKEYLVDDYYTECWIDSAGNVYTDDEVNSTEEEQSTTKKGNIPVRRETLTRETLDYLGKDSEGKDKYWMWNNKFWNDAERLGTMNEKEIGKYKDIGYSPYQQVWEPGSIAEYGWESAKMSSFIAVDAGTAALGYGAGIGMRALGASEKLLKAATTLNQVTNGVLSAVGIGHQYGIGVFNENVQHNMLELETRAMNDAKEVVESSLNGDPEYAERFNEEVSNRAKLRVQQQLEQYYNLQRQALDNGQTPIEPNVDELTKAALAQAAEEVREERIKKTYETIKNSPEYYEDVVNASEIAANAAMIGSLTDALKYGVVNLVGFRKFLFTPKENLMGGFFKDLRKGFSNGAKGLEYKSAFRSAGSKAKQLGGITASQLWGGAWTNYTDELQMAGARNINNQTFEDYLNGEYDPEAITTLDDMSNTFSYYTTGGVSFALDPQAIKAGIIGGVGGTFGGMFNYMGAGNFILNKAERQRISGLWNTGQKRRAAMEIANSFISNGVLNNYYSKMAADEQISAYVEQVNKLEEELPIFRDLMTSKLSNIDATRPEEKAIANFLEGLAVMRALNETGFKNPKEHIQDYLGVARESSAVMDAFNFVNEVMQNGIPEEMKEALLEEYYAKNPTLIKNDEDDERALQQIEENVKTLNQANDLYNETMEELAEYEKRNNVTINNTTKRVITTRRALSTIVKQQLDNLGVTTGMEKGDASMAESMYMTEEARATYNTTIEKQIEKWEKSKEEQQKVLQEAEDKIAAFEEEHITQSKILRRKGFDPSKLDTGEAFEYANLLASRDNEALTLRYYEETIADAKKRMEEPTSTEVGTITEEIIDAMPLAQRFNLLHPDNLQNYSKENQKTITDYLVKQINKDPEYLDKLYEGGRMQLFLDSNAKTLAQLHLHPDAAAVNFAKKEEISYRIAQQFRDRVFLENTNNYFKRALKAFTNGSRLRESNPEEISNLIKRIERGERLGIDELPKLLNGEDAFNNFLFRQVRVMNPRILQKLINETNNPETEFYELLKYKPILEQALDWSSELSNIDAGINTLREELESEEEADPVKIGKDIKKFKDSISKILDNSDSMKAVHEEIEKRAGYRRVNADKYKRLNEILKGIKAVKKAASDKGAIKPSDAVEETSETTLPEITPEEVEESGESLADSGNDTTTPIIDSEETKEELNDDADMEPQEGDIVVPVDTRTIADEESGEIVEIGGTDTSSGGKALKPGGEEILVGNRLPKYDIEKIANEATEEKRVPDNNNTIFAKWLEWCETNGVNYQNIIDFELSSILKVEPNLRFAYANSNSKEDINLVNRGRKNSKNNTSIPLLVVEYTDKVKAIHNEDYGGVIEGHDGKQYLIVGEYGYENTQNSKAWFDEVNKAHADIKKQLEDSNKDKRFIIIPGHHTEVSSMATGYIVKQMEGRDKASESSIRELLQGKDKNLTNPKKLAFKDLAWAIQRVNDFMIINSRGRDYKTPNARAQLEFGRVYLMLEGTNGVLVPVEILPKKLGDIGKNSILSNTIYSLIEKLASADYNERQGAKDNLKHYIVLKTRTVDGQVYNNINVGDVDNNIVTITDERGVRKVFNLRDSDFSVAQLIKAVETLNPRINITRDTLTSKSNFDMYSEAGALNVDIAALYTRASSYKVYPIDREGNIKKTPKSSTTQDTSDSSGNIFENRIRNIENAIQLNGSLYYTKDGKWFDNNTKTELTNPRLITQLELLNTILDKFGRKGRPSLTETFKNGNSTNYYVISDVTGKEYVIGETASNNSPGKSYYRLTSSEAKRVIEKVEKALAEKQAATNTEDILNNPEAIEGEQSEDITDQINTLLGLTPDSSDITDSKVTNTDTPPETVVTEDEVLESQLGTGKPETPVPLIVTAEDKVVEKIKEDSENIELTEDQSVYKNLDTKEEYARVTSVEGAKDDAAPRFNEQPSEERLQVIDLDGSSVFKPNYWNTAADNETINGKKGWGRENNLDYYKPTSDSPLVFWFREDIPSEIKADIAAIIDSAPDTNTAISDVTMFLNGHIENAWSVPSSTLGDTNDTFVRDLVELWQENPDSPDLLAADRVRNYPNSSASDWVEYGTEFIERVLKPRQKDGVKFVPKDIKASGEIQVNAKDGTVYRLKVAGTLDLLVYKSGDGFDIYDMKAIRSLDSKKVKNWQTQLSLYAAFLENKYGIKVNNLYVIPTQVSSYETPYKAPNESGWAGTAKYSVKEGQLYNGENKVEVKYSLFAEGEHRGYDFNFTIKNGALALSKIGLESMNFLYDKLGIREQGLCEKVRTLEDGTPEPHSESRVDINSMKGKNLKKLKTEKNNASSVKSKLRETEFRNRVIKTLIDKGYNKESVKSPRGIMSIFESKGNWELDNISDWDAWFDRFEQCF